VLGTIAPPEWHNSVQDEIITACALKSIAPNPADDTQLAQLLSPSVLVVEGNAGTGSSIDTTTYKNAVIGCTSSQAGDGSTEHALTAASNAVAARGEYSAVGASENVRTNGERSVVLASAGATAGHLVIQTGVQNAAVIACGMLDSDSIISAGQSVIMAARDGKIRRPQSAIIASAGGDVGSHDSVIIASGAGRIDEENDSYGNMIAASFRGSGNPDIIGDGGSSPARGCVIMANGDELADPNRCHGTSNIIAASSDSEINSIGSAIIGGGAHEIDTATGAAILGGASNEISGGSGNAVILGGADNEISNAKLSSAILGSEECVIAGAAGQRTTIIAGRNVVAASAGATGQYQVMGGDNGATPGGPRWRIAGDGEFFGNGAFNTSGADYAEFFRNADGIAHPVGRIVSRVGRAVTLGQPGKRPLSVVTANPSVIGNADAAGWAGRFRRSEFGEPIYTPDGERAVDPSYDHTKRHVPRSERPEEHTLVALLGQVLCAVGEGVQADDYLTCGPDGLGVAADFPTRIEVMEIARPFDAAKGYAVAWVLVR